MNNDEVNKNLSDSGQSNQTITDDYDYAKGGYGYYENVYEELNTQMVEDIGKKKYTFPGENPGILNDDSTTDNPGEGDSSGTGGSGGSIGSDVIIPPINSGTTSPGESLNVLMGGAFIEGTTTIKNLDTVGSQSNPCIYIGENIEKYPYYKYTIIGDLDYIKEQAEKSSSDTSASNRKNGDITKESDQYWYWTVDADGKAKKEALYIVTGRQSVSIKQLHQIDESITYPYYYKVSKCELVCKLKENGSKTNPEDYTYTGWYYASHPSGEDAYLPVSDNETGMDEDLKPITHYISEAGYTLTPGKGDYDFVENEKEKEQSVKVDHLFYQGGYENHDWLKRHVFHLDPDSEDKTVQQQFQSFAIKVDTKTVNVDGSLDSSDSGGETLNPDFSKYDLIYINGKISKDMAEKIAKLATNSQMPVIINQNKALVDSDSKKIIEDAFVGYTEENLIEQKQDFVSRCVYFISADILHQTFPTTITDKDLLENFAEISKYISSENAFRSTIDSAEDTKTLSLEEKISKARAVEYIINYQYKRKITTKSELNILDIEPADANGSLTKETVQTWLGTDTTGKITDFCCEQDDDKEHASITNATDGNLNTFWHSLWNDSYYNDTNHISPKHEGNHYFIYTLADSTVPLEGFYFAARPKSNYPNGRPFELKVTVMKKNETLATKTFEFGQNDNYWDKKEYKFDKAIEGATSIKVEYLKTYWNKNTSNPNVRTFAACAEFGPLYSTKENDTKINITTMTSSEFVGHIDDINAKYDAIYFGDSYTGWDLLRNGDGTNENDNKKTSLYAHVGGVFGGTKDQSLGNDVQNHRWTVSRLMGLLDIDYAKDKDGNFILNGNKKKALWSPNRVTDTKIKDKVGRMRGSGNDITKQQVKELKAFMSSGYPIIIGDKLLKNGKVNTDVVDSSSYMYQFLSKAVSDNRQNVMSWTQASQRQNLSFFFYLSKPEIRFSKMPPEPQRLNEDKADYKYNKAAELGNLTGEKMTWEFKIENEAEISLANATYNCELFFDLNFDGNLSSKEEQSEYMQIQDESGTVQKKTDGKYHLKLGKTYILTRKVPKEYYKIITWKIQISNNANNSIRTSTVGFTKRQADANQKQKIKVLQIYPDKESGMSQVTWKLDKDDILKQMLAQVKDFDIEITSINTRTYEKYFDKQHNNGNDSKVNKNILEEYQMVVLGFADGFGEDNICNKHGEVDAIRKFVEDGKSLILTHDAISFVSVDDDTLFSNNSLYNPQTKGYDGMGNFWRWAYSFNAYLRATVGMDRYGISSDKKITVDGKESTVQKELRKGNDLLSSESIYKAIQEKVSDMAYSFSNTSVSSFMTQGFSNNIIVEHTNRTTKAVSKVNEGAITQYPYYMEDTLKTAATHSQYYQLAMEQDDDKDGSNDIVVWYCLADDGLNNTRSGAYKDSPNDVRNSYYFYSKGNVIYTGIGDATNDKYEVIGPDAFTKQERNLFVNAIVAAARVTAVEPEITFLDDFDPAANKEEYRYFVADHLNIDGDNLVSKESDFQLLIRDYNMVANSLNEKDNNSGSLSLELYIQDDENGIEQEIKGDTVKVTKLKGDNISALTKYSDSDGKKIIADKDGTFQLEGNDTLQFKIPNLEKYLKSNGNYKQNCKIYAKVTSSVSLYGQNTKKDAWTSVELRQRQLFDMD